MGNICCGNNSGYELDTQKKFKRRPLEDLKKNYAFNDRSEVLGSGSFGKVYLSHNLYVSDMKVAIKVLNKAKLQNHLEIIQEEIEVLQKLDHPNIVRYYETYEDKKNIYIVMEYVGGGELFNFIVQQQNQVFSERKAKEYMKTLLQALNHIHSQGIVHRDIKPENIMVTLNH